MAKNMKTKILLFISCLATIAQTAMALTTQQIYFNKGNEYLGGEGVSQSDSFVSIDISSEGPVPCPTGWKIGEICYADEPMHAQAAPSNWETYIDRGYFAKATVDEDWILDGTYLKIAVKDGYKSYAVRYDPVDYNISFAKNGDDASGKMANMTGISFTNTTTKLTANAFTRTGYAFGGWTNSTGTAFANQAAVDGEKFGVTTDGETVTLYAKWTANGYSLTYDENSGTAGSSRPATAAYGETFLVSAPTRTGYDLTGWKLANYDTSTILYGSGETTCTSSIAPTTNIVAATGDVYFKNLTPTNGAAVTLTAQWKPIVTTIKFSGEGAETTTDDRDIEYDQSPDGYQTVAKPTRSDGQFLGYYTQKSGDGIQYFDQDGHLTRTWDIAESEVTLYACWKIDYSRTSKLVVNGGILDKTEVTITIGNAYGDLPVPTWKDYKKAFAGWSTETSGGTAVTPSDIVPDPAPATLYALWTNTLYTVRFDGNEATDGVMADQSVEFNVSTQLTANAYSRTGYAFAGWATTADATKAAYTNCASSSEFEKLATSAGATVNLYAVWSKNTYYVAFDANGGSGTMPTLTNSYDVAFTIPANAFTQDASKFLAFDHWLDEATGKTYAEGETATNLTATADETVTLKAVWKSTLSELSTAMHCTTLNWENYLTSAWEACNESGSGHGSDSCARVAKMATMHATMSVADETAEPEIVFWWKPSSASAKLQIGHAKGTTPTSSDRIDIAATGIEWQKVTYKITKKQGTGSEYLISITRPKANGDGVYDCIDFYGSAYPEPTAADAVTVSSFAATTDGGWSISFTGSESFAYRVLYTDSLSSPNWQVYTDATEQVGTGAAQSFAITRDADVPTRFFKIETIQRQ